MAYNTRKMLEDSNGDLIPQYFNQSADRYEQLRGADGVSFTGNHVMTESGIWVPQRGSDDGAAHTQLTGSIVKETILERFIFNGTNSQYTNFYPPNDARGVIIAVNVFGGTGDFSKEDDGFSVRLNSYTIGSDSVENAIEIASDKTKRNDISFLFYIHPEGIDLKDGKPRNSNRLKVYKSRITIMERMSIFLYLDGIVKEDEGYDIEVRAVWLK